MLILIKGGGDLASGLASVLFSAGFGVVISEIEKPTTVRRAVSFSTAVFEKEHTVEGIKARLCNNLEEVENVLGNKEIPVIIDPGAKSVKDLKPEVVIDAIVAKKNVGTNITDAPFVIALGPGFTAGVDCHCVIETNRGVSLGEVIYQGSAIPNTGIPGELGGESVRRVLRAGATGVFCGVKQIGDNAQAGEVVAYVENSPIIAEISGVVRGMLMDGLMVKPHTKCGDIDPRGDVNLCYQISDKAKQVGQGALKAVLDYQEKKEIKGGV